jgi:hypothetical protein
VGFAKLDVSDATFGAPDVEKPFYFWHRVEKLLASFFGPGRSVALTAGLVPGPIAHASRKERRCACAVCHAEGANAMMLLEFCGLFIMRA